MKVVISAGGTGGHIYPALAIIDKIKEKEPNSEFIYIGTHNRMEKDIVPKRNIPFEAIEMYGFDRKHLLKNFKTIKCLLKAKKKCRELIKNFNPDIVIGVGGYVTTPVISEAHKLGFKTFIHEQNSNPGKANKFLSKYASLIGVSFKSTINKFDNNNVIFTGNPCSESALNSKTISKKTYNLIESKKLVLIVMGSLGATKVNEYLEKTMSLFNGKDYEILFVTGQNSYEKLKDIKKSINVHIVPYIDNLTGIMKNTDLIVSRAGASTLSEIIALNIPSILIPSPYVPDNHQYKNAMDLVNKESALIIEEKDLNGDILVRTIDSVLSDTNKIKKIKSNLRDLSVKDSATIIYNEIRKLIDRK